MPQALKRHDGDGGDDLAGTARRWLNGSATAEDLHEAFLSATVFLQAGDRPGLMAFGNPPDGMIPVWTSEAELAQTSTRSNCSTFSVEES